MHRKLPSMYESGARVRAPALSFCQIEHGFVGLLGPSVCKQGVKRLDNLTEVTVCWCLGEGDMRVGLEATVLLSSSDAVRLGWDSFA